MLCCLFLCGGILVFAQFEEHFDDGNFTMNPEWLGNTENFIVNGSGQLQLMDVAANTSYIYTPVSTLDSTTWEFFLNMDFAPSGSNQLEVYLSSDAPDLTGSLNGYFIRIGESGTDDLVELRRRNGSNSTLVLEGTPGAVANNPAIARIRVTRDNIGNWELFADYSGGFNFTSEATAFDDTYPSGNYFGFVCKYTVSNTENFVFDDILIGPLFTDTDPPVMESVIPFSNTQIDLEFNEPLEQTTAETITNYSINNGISISSAILDPNLTTVHLVVSPLTSGTTYSITSNNIEDLNNNLSEEESLNFTFIQLEEAEPFDILINEIHPKPNSETSLPDAEFFELYNRSDKAIDLNGFQFTDLSATVGVFPAYILLPDAYLIVCKALDLSLFSTFGAAVGLSSFPTLNDDGDDIFIRDVNGQIIHNVNYHNSWYRDNLKDDGGWSLELINPNLFCLGADNWIASTDNRGGTPGEQNTVFTNIPDNTPPEIVAAVSVNENQVIVSFNEVLDFGSATTLENYSVNNGIGTPIDVELLENEKEVLLTLSLNFIDQTTYTLSISAVSDCIGNPINASTITFDFIKTEEANRYDIIINEIYADPEPSIGLPEREFVELYNRSDKAINLEGYTLFEGTNDPPVLPFYILRPGTFVILQKEDVFINFLSFGDVIMLSKLALTNTGETISINDPFGNIIDAVAYSDQWYESGRNEGGYSLERINPDAPCITDQQNWGGSLANLGGTPGAENSIILNTIDENVPDLIKAFIDVNIPDKLTLFFDKAMEETQITDINNYNISETSVEIVTIELLPPLFDQVVIQFAQPIQAGIQYQISLNSNITDCLSNSIGMENTARFALSEEVFPSDIIINEVLHNPSTGGSRFVELFNRSDKIINTGDLFLAKRDEDNNIAFVNAVETSCLLFPDEYIVLTPSPDDIRDRYLSLNPKAFIETAVPTYDDKEDAVILMTSGSVIIDELQYTSTFHNELIDDLNGVSLERIDPDASTQSAANWHSAAKSVGWATPTYQNSQFLNNPNSANMGIELVTPTISPDGDGFEDFLLLNYQLAVSGFLANIHIYDAEGRLIKKLVENDLLALEGSYRWDGATDEGQKARIGIYVLWVELFNADGDTQHFKETFVVAGRF